jgi:hypothetical protein
MALGGTKYRLAIIGGLLQLLLLLLQLRRLVKRRELEEQKAVEERVSFHFV